MIQKIKSVTKTFPVAYQIYLKLRGYIDVAQSRSDAIRYFENHKLYLRNLTKKDNGTVDLQTRDGLIITIRQNIYDARIIKEIFFQKPYVRHFNLSENPTIVDIGGYIGDFSLYAAKYLNPRKIIVYEPTSENFKILLRNIKNNSFEGVISAVNKAVSNASEICLNTEILEHDEVHVSSYWYQDSEKRPTPSVTLSDLLDVHNIDTLDLLKVDCEGGEYDIFPSVENETYEKIKNIVFEFHRVERFEVKLRKVLNRLESTGYKIRVDGQIAYAYRT